MRVKNGDTRRIIQLRQTGDGRFGKVLLVGEPMVLFTAANEGNLDSVNQFEATIAGAELNVATGLSRLNVEVSYVTRVGKDSFGRRITRFLENNGIDTGYVTVDPLHQTGFMLKSKEINRDPVVDYYRRNSAASQLCSDDIGNINWDNISILHITGILPPLSSNTLDLTYSLCKKAKENGVFISFDPNLRPQLWPDIETMKHTILDVCRLADLVMPGISEAITLTGKQTLEDAAAAFLNLGTPRYCVVKDGSRGAYITDGEFSYYANAFKVEKIVDTVGAGDGFAAGFLSAIIEQRPLEYALHRACAVGAIQTQFVSDNEGLPTHMEIERFIKQHTDFVAL